MAAIPILVISLEVLIGIYRSIVYARHRAQTLGILSQESSAEADRAWRMYLGLQQLPSWQLKLIATLTVPMDVTTWPVVEVQAHQIARGRDPATFEYSSLALCLRALLTCVLTVILGSAAALVVAGSKYTIALAVTIAALTWILLLSAIGRQLIDILFGNFVATAARVSGHQPLRGYRDAIVTVLADLVTLYCAAVVLLFWNAKEPLRRFWYPHEVEALVNGGYGGLWQALSQSPSAVLVATATLTFGASLIKPLKNAVLSRRSGDDLMMAAQNAAQRREVIRAHRLLEKGRARTKTLSSRLLAKTECELALVENRTDDAWAAARMFVRAVTPDKDLKDLIQSEDGLVAMQQWSTELGVALAPTVSSWRSSYQCGTA